MSGHASHALRLQSPPASKPSGFKAWRLFAHGLQTLSRLLNARALSGSNPQLT